VWSASHPGRFTPKERAPGTHWLGGWVGWGTNKLAMAVIGALLGFEISPFQGVSHVGDYLGTGPV